MYKTIPFFVGKIGDRLQPVFSEKNFNAQPIESYENITREDDVLKIILVPPGVANDTYVRGGGNRIFIYGKDIKGFDLATMRTILIAMDYKA
jgi:thiamine pyrophosphokinase